MEVSVQPAQVRTWTVGMLRYDGNQLAKVFFWLLWGDFCLTLMDNGVASTLVSLQLKKYGASNALIGLLNGTTIALLSALLVSIISTNSDRTRSRLGRRMPYLLFSAWPIAGLLTLWGFAPQIAKVLSRASPALADSISAVTCRLVPGCENLPASAALVLAMLMFFVVLYRIVDLFPQSIYYCLWADVIPAKLMGTFACLFRVVAALGMFVFERYLLALADRSPATICLIAAGLYATSFTAISLLVKEGKYPDQPQRAIESPLASLIRSVRVFIQECYGSSYFWIYFLMNAFYIIAIKSLQQFLLFFGTESLRLSPQRYGQLISWRNPVSVLPFLIMGPLADRYHPLRAGIVAGPLMVAAGLACFFGIHGERSFEILTILLFTAIATYQAATAAIGPRLLPINKYGQFTAANSVVWQLGWAFSSLLCGWMLDALTRPTGNRLPHPEGYRYLFIWFSVLTALGFIASILLLKRCRSRGAFGSASTDD